ncbi:hypothetical protein [Cryptosporangium sp. NPDC048952]|uniref:hypothetical protein n=1 Tax=Cryptosporangium sp. NPDC048952 TaxID=3363961 RepID=UPI003718A4CE
MNGAAQVVLVVGLPLLVVVVTLVLVARRNRRIAAELGARESVTALSRLPLKENWRIRQAIHGGRAVDDPALASVAADRADYLVRAGENYEKRMRRLRWVYIVFGALLVFIVVIRSSDGLQRDDWAPLGLYVALAVLILGQRPWMRHRTRRATAASDANHALAAEHPDARWTGPTLDPRATFRQRAILGWVVIVVVATPLYYGLGRALDAPIGWGWAVLTSAFVATATIASLWYTSPPRPS